MPNAICIDCQTEMRLDEIGVVLVEMAFDPPTPYRLWSADTSKCPGCGKVVVNRFANRPYAYHHQEDFAELLQGAIDNTNLKVFYCYEKPQTKPKE